MPLGGGGHDPKCPSPLDPPVRNEFGLRKYYLATAFIATNLIFLVNMPIAHISFKKSQKISESFYIFVLTFASLHWGGVFEPPCGFSRIARKRTRETPPGFNLPYSPYFRQLV